MVFVDLMVGVVVDVECCVLLCLLVDVERQVFVCFVVKDVFVVFVLVDCVKIIVEVKCVFFFCGVFVEIFDFVLQVFLYEIGGVFVISVLIEECCFGGSFVDLEVVIVCVLLFVLCKDFIVICYQVLEVCVVGVDLVLFIVVGIELVVLQDLFGFIIELGMILFVEMYFVDEFEVVIDFGVFLIGVNVCDLKMFEFDCDLFG